MSTLHKLTVFGTAATLSMTLAAATTIPTAFAAPKAPDTSGAIPAAGAGHTYPDGANISFPDTWTKGQPLVFKGTGFKAKDGSPSVVAIKVNGGGVSGQPYLRVDADKDGNISGAIPWQDNLKVGDKVVINLLSGSLNKNDHNRGGEATVVTVVEISMTPPKPAPTDMPKPSQPAPSPGNPTTTPAPTTPAPTPTPTEEPKPTDPAPSPTDSSPAPSQTPAPEPSGSASPSPSVTDPGSNGGGTGAGSGGGAGAGTGGNGPQGNGTTGQSNNQNTGKTSSTIPPGAPKNCAELGKKDVKKGSPDYYDHLDRDKDGVACESGDGNGKSGSKTGNGGSAAGSGSGSDATTSGNSRGSAVTPGRSATSGATSANQRKGPLASTGATGAVAGAAVGLFALGAGASAVWIARRRGSKNSSD